MLGLPVGLMFFGRSSQLFFDFLVLFELLALHVVCLATPVVEYDLSAFVLSPACVSGLLLCCLLLEESLNLVLLVLGSIKALLDLPLIH